MSARLTHLGVPEQSADDFAEVIPTPAGVGGSTDVTECDREPISVPGSIQPHGALLVLDEPSLRIERASSNLVDVVGVEALSVLGARLPRVLGQDGASLIEAAVAVQRAGRIGPLVLDLGGADGDIGTTADSDVVRTCDVTLHRTPDARLVLEIEPALAVSPVGYPSTTATALLRLHTATDLASLLQQTVQEVADLTGFERVMLYRFNSEGDGEVVAERTAPGTESYLGLRYPGSDIPRQARELYRRQWLRLIVDSDYTPSPLLPLQQAGDADPVDLSHAALRSVSPVHLQYLRNMGVAASMSMSVVVSDQLWGLILCHGSARHPVPSAVRTACEQIAQFVSMQVESRRTTARLAADLRAQRLRTVLVDQLQAPVPAAGLLGAVGGPGEPGSPGVELRDVVTCGTAAGRLEGQTVVSGDLLDAPTADRLAALLRTAVSADAGPAGGSVVSSSLPLDLPDAARLLQDAGARDVAGVLLVGIDGGADDNYLLWVRREVEQTVNWAGEPAVKHQSGSLSPRASFALWREKVRDHAQPWEQADVDVAVQLSEAVAARLRHLDEMTLVAAAVRNEELFQREHEIADALQRGMLPVLPELPDLTLSASYLSASESAEVGGDWYDVFTMPDGAIGIAMGDVTGHDLAAAAAMGQLRSVLRSYAWEESSPERVLDKVDALVDGFSMRHLATVFFGRLERDDAGDVLLRYANAGHLPPVLRRPDGTVSLLEDGLSVLIGVGVDIGHEVATCPVPAGSTLLLYTDGLVEQRDRGVAEGIEQLRDVVRGAPSDVDELREHVLAEMVPGRREDDIAVLVVHVH